MTLHQRTLLAVILMCASTVMAQTLYVDGTNGDDSWTGLSPTYTGGNEGPKKTIYNAAQAATPYADLVVLDGTYSGTQNTGASVFNMIYQKYLHFQSQNGPDDCTLLLNQLLSFSSIAPSSTYANFEGFTFTGIVNTGPVINFYGDSRCTFTRCIFREIILTSSASFISVRDMSHPVFDQCIFTQLDGYIMPIIECRVTSQPVFTACDFTDNFNMPDLNIISLFDQCQASFSNCSFTDNISTEDLKIIFLENQAYASLTDVVIENNTSYTFATSELRGIYCCGQAALAITNSRIGNLNALNTSLAQSIGIDASMLADPHPTITPQIEITNSTITHIHSNLNGGGGVRLSAGASPVKNCIVRDCVISNNSAYQGGGIICLGNVDVTVTGCTIQNNLIATNGGGIFGGGVSPRLLAENCLITHNARGGIIFNTEEPRVTVNNCTIADNNYCGIVAKAAQISNSIIYGNLGQGWSYQIDDPTAVVNYCDVQYGWPGAGTGNFNLAPLFAVEAADYHLQSQAGRYDPATGAWTQDDLSSPCIDAGDPADGVGDEPLGNGGRINIGVYGGTAQASLTHICTGKIPGDANNDCEVNLVDLAALASHWLESTRGHGPI